MNQFLLGFCVLFAACSMKPIVGTHQPASLRCEYQVDPLAVDDPSPRLSWTIESEDRGVIQTAYRVLVASSPELLIRNTGDLWDSGQVPSSQSAHIEYDGSPLISNTTYYWKVRVWDQKGEVSPWSSVANWSMAFLSPEEWRARWICAPGQKPRMSIDNAMYIWKIPEGGNPRRPPPGNCTLWRIFELPNDVKVKEAELYVAADESAVVKLNGKIISKVPAWNQGRIVDVTNDLVPGENKLLLDAEFGGRSSGIVCKLRAAFDDGQVVEIISDREWLVTNQNEPDQVVQATEVDAWGTGRWGYDVTFAEDKPGVGLPVFKKSFSVDRKVENALVHVTGLGHFELFLNGKKVGQNFLDPAWSVYEKTAYYQTFDIGELLRQGENEFRIMVGKGFYNTQGDRRVHGVSNWGTLMAILEARLQFRDGTEQLIRTDDSWEVGNGPITHSSILAGSDYDARLADPQVWLKAAVASAEGTLRVAESPSMALFERLTPVKNPDEPEPGFFVYDFGENLSSIPVIQVRGKRGATVRVTPAEQRHQQTGRQNNGTGRVNQAGVGRPNYYEYTLKGEGSEQWQPQFTYGGFQYLEISGAVPEGFPNPDQLPVVEKLEAVHVRNSARTVGSFDCSNPLFVAIDRMIDRSVRSNLAHVLTDCPTREKLGWLEVSYLMGPSIAMRYDLSRLYAKVARDVRESQGDDGIMYTVGPNYPIFKKHFRYTPEWGAAGVIIPWQLYTWYGDERVLSESFGAMKRFVDYMKNTGENLVPKAGLGDWYDYGHGKGSGPAKFTAPELTAMATFYRCARIVASTAEVLGNNIEAESYRKLSDNIRTRFNEEFYQGNGEYKNNGSPQTANAMALITGLCEPENEEAVMQAIIADLKKRDYQQTAGDIGFHYLVEALGCFGHNDIVHKIANRREEGSYGHILDLGWNSLPEAWDANTGASMNHCMLGHIQQWFSRDVLGIRQAEDSIAFRDIIIRPAFEIDLEWAKGHYDALPGRISVDWKKKECECTLKVSIPANTSAKVYLPAKDPTTIRESGKGLEASDGVQSVERKNMNTVITISSGHYSFSFQTGI
jgi:alpha-L-rhamnosidase